MMSAFVLCEKCGAEYAAAFDPEQLPNSKTVPCWACGAPAYIQYGGRRDTPLPPAGWFPEETA